MKKWKITSLGLLLVVLCLSVACVCFNVSADDVSIVYVSDTGSDSAAGTSASAPFLTLNRAYEVLGDEGGIIRIVGTLTNSLAEGMTKGFWEPRHSGKVIIEGNDSTATLYLKNAGGVVRSRFYLSGDTEFRNLKIHHDNGGIIGACHNTLTMGEGLSMSGAGTLYLFGGCYELGMTGLVSQADHTTNDTHIVVKSGAYRQITGGDYVNTSTSVCYKAGATHNVEILGNISVDYIVLGHNKKTSAGVSANLVIDGNITGNPNDSGIYFGGTSATLKIDETNVLYKRGDISTIKYIHINNFSGDGFSLYYDAENTSIASTISMLKGKVSSDTTATYGSEADWCEDVVGAHDYVSGICTSCGSTDGVGGGDDTTVGDTTAGDTTVGDTTADDTTAEDTTAGDTTTEGTQDGEDTPAEEKVFFVKVGGTGNGKSPETPAGKLTDMYYAAGNSDATIVIMDQLVVDGTFNEPAHKGTIKIVGKYDGVDYNGSVLFSGGQRWVLGGATEFYDILFKIGDGTPSTLTGVVVCHFNPVLFGDGFESQGGEFYVVGGVIGSADKTAFDEASGKFRANVSIKALSGDFFEIVGFARQGCAGGLDGDIDIFVGGDARIKKLAVGARNINDTVTMGEGKLTLDGGIIDVWCCVSDKKNNSGFTDGFKLYLTKNFKVSKSFTFGVDAGVINGFSGSSVWESNASDRVGTTAAYVEAGIYDEFISSDIYSAASFDNLKKVANGSILEGVDTSDYTPVLAAFAVVCVLGVVVSAVLVQRKKESAGCDR